MFPCPFYYQAAPIAFSPHYRDRNIFFSLKILAGYGFFMAAKTLQAAAEKWNLPLRIQRPLELEIPDGDDLGPDEEKSRRLRRRNPMPDPQGLLREMPFAPARPEIVVRELVRKEKLCPQFLQPLLEGRDILNRKPDLTFEQRRHDVPPNAS